MPSSKVSAEEALHHPAVSSVRESVRAGPTKSPPAYFRAFLLPPIPESRRRLSASFPISDDMLAACALTMPSGVRCEQRARVSMSCSKFMKSATFARLQLVVFSSRITAAIACSLCRLKFPPGFPLCPGLN